MPVNDCQTATDGDYQVVSVSGEVDLSWSSRVRSEILSALVEGNTLVDLSAVTYIDSSGIAALVEGYQTAKKNGQRFGLLATSDAVVKVLELARLDQVFPMYADLQAASAAS